MCRLFPQKRKEHVYFVISTCYIPEEAIPKILGKGTSHVPCSYV